MFAREELRDVTCAAGVQANAPVEVPLAFNTGILRAFEIVIPDGHSGQTGIALGYGHNPVLPYTTGAFWSGNDEVIRREYLDHVPGVQWSAFVCNLDLIAHTWQIRFLYDELADAPAVRVVQPVTVDEILAAGDQSQQQA